VPESVLSDEYQPTLTTGHPIDLVSGQDISADPYAGQTAPNGKEIWSADQAADNLARYGVDFTHGNNGALDDGVLTYGFWTSADEALNSYYGEINPAGYVLTSDSVYLYGGYFAPFNAEQQAMAIANMQLWDDLIAITIKPATSASEADITFGFTAMSPAAGAHTTLPQEEYLNSLGFVNAGKAAGDVWANILHQDSFEDTSIGDYAWQAITHELGHSLGLAHGGDYNASNGVPITYQGSAYFYQDSQQYTIMSYFDGAYTGQAAVKWNGADSAFMYAQTPQVHDILAVQNIYGADYTTRSGDTVYGFHSTADRGVFDFSTNTAPIVTIWDGGGKDTLDLSGFNGDDFIDLHEGAFSSAGFKIDASTKAFFGEAFGLQTEQDFDDFYAGNGLGPDGRPNDNIAIAYGAEIENAIGGSGNDTIVGNALGNHLVGNAGNDTFYTGDGFDVVSMGAGNDMFVAELGTRSFSKVGNLSWDIVTDFSAGDKIDLSELDKAFHFIGTNANKGLGDLSYKVYDSVNGAEKALGIDIDGHDGASDIAGPVTVVFANVDGGTPDIGLVLLNHSGVASGDFIFG